MEQHASQLMALADELLIEIISHIQGGFTSLGGRILQRQLLSTLRRDIDIDKFLVIRKEKWPEFIDIDIELDMTYLYPLMT
jgi:hypothetical protein